MLLCAAAAQVAIVLLEYVAEEGDAQHRIRRDPRHGVGGAEGVEGHGRCIGADGAAGKQPRQHQTHGDTRHQLRPMPCTQLRTTKTKPRNRYMEKSTYSSELP